MLLIVFNIDSPFSPLIYSGSDNGISLTAAKIEYCLLPASSSPEGVLSSTNENSATSSSAAGKVSEKPYGYGPPASWLDVMIRLPSI